jgi:hypothetical protein
MWKKAVSPSQGLVLRSMEISAKRKKFNFKNIKTNQIFLNHFLTTLWTKVFNPKKIKLLIVTSPILSKYLIFLRRNSFLTEIFPSKMKLSKIFSCLWGHSRWSAILCKDKEKSTGFFINKWLKSRQKEDFVNSK